MQNITAIKDSSLKLKSQVQALLWPVTVPAYLEKCRDISRSFEVNPTNRGSGRYEQLLNCAIVNYRYDRGGR